MTRVGAPGSADGHLSGAAPAPVCSSVRSRGQRGANRRDPTAGIPGPGSDRAASRPPAARRGERGRLRPTCTARAQSRAAAPAACCWAGLCGCSSARRRGHRLRQYGYGTGAPSPTRKVIRNGDSDATAAVGTRGARRLQDAALRAGIAAREGNNAAAFSRDPDRAARRPSRGRPERAAATSPPHGGAAVPRPTEAPPRPGPAAPLRRAAPPRGRRNRRQRTAPLGGERGVGPRLLLPCETAARRARAARPSRPRPLPQRPALPVRRSEGGAAGIPAPTPRAAAVPPARRAEPGAKRGGSRGPRRLQPRRSVASRLRSKRLIQELRSNCDSCVRPHAAPADTNDGVS